MVGLPEAFSDPVFLLLLVSVLLFILFVYFLLRRTFLGLKQGYEEGRRN